MHLLNAHKGHKITGRSLKRNSRLLKDINKPTKVESGRRVTIFTNGGEKHAFTQTNFSQNNDIHEDKIHLPSKLYKLRIFLPKYYKAFMF